MQKQTKKGSLSLSINAIVVLIMAIAMLGVGIFFINSVLRDNISGIGEVPDSVRQQLESLMQQTGEKLYIDGLRENTLAIPLRNEGRITVAMNNQRESIGHYAIHIQAVRGWDGEGEPITETPSSPIDRGVRIQGLTIDDPDNIEVFDATRISIGEYGMQTITFRAGNQRGRVLYQVSVYVADEPEGTGNPVFELYEQQTFFVQIQ